MGWVFYSFVTALTRTVKDIGYKIVLGETGALEVVFCFFIFSFIFLFPLAIWKLRRMKIKGEAIFPNRTALYALIGCGIFNILGYWVFSLALKGGEFSVVVPLRNLVPLFSLVIGVLILKEKINLRIIGATFLVVAGVVFLHFNGDIWSGTNVFQNVFSTASLLAILAAFFFTICAMADRYGTAKEYGRMNVLLYTTGTVLIMITGFGLAVFFKGTTNEVMGIITTYWPTLLLVGSLGAFGTWATFKALSLGEMTKVTPLLRAQVLLSIIFGGAFFNEENLIYKTIGGILLTLGIILIVISREKKLLK